MADQSHSLCRRRGLLRQAGPSRARSASSAAPPMAATGSTCWAPWRPTPSSCIPAIPRRCSPAPTTACGAAPTAAPPSAAPASPTPRSRSGRFMVDQPRSQPHLRRRLADRRLSQRRWRRELAQARRRRRSARIARGPSPPASCACAEPQEARRDLCRAGNQRRDAQHRRRPRPGQDCSAGLIEALRAAASQEQDRERHHGRGHARRPRRDHQRGRSRSPHRGAAHGPVPHPRPAARAGRTWRSAASRPPPTAATSSVSPAEPNTLYAALSVAAASHDGGLYRSADGGQSWQRFDKVQVHGTIMSIGLHPSDRRAGLYRRPLRRRGVRHPATPARPGRRCRCRARSSTSIRWRVADTKPRRPDRARSAEWRTPPKFPLLQRSDCAVAS